MATTVIKNLFLPLLIVLVLYAIPVVPTWRALKRKKASFGAFLGWIAGEMVALNLLMSFFMFLLKFDYIFPILFVGVFISSLFFAVLPFIVTNKVRNWNKVIIGFLVLIIIAVLQIYGMFCLIAYSASQIKNF